MLNFATICQQASVARLRSFVKRISVTYLKTFTAYHALFRGMVRRFCILRARDGPQPAAFEKRKKHSSNTHD